VCHRPESDTTLFWLIAERSIIAPREAYVTLSIDKPHLLFIYNAPASAIFFRLRIFKRAISASMRRS
jgi:hypothetical protein